MLQLLVWQHPNKHRYASEVLKTGILKTPKGIPKDSKQKIICICQISRFTIKLCLQEEVKLYAGKNQLHKLADAYPLWNNLVGYWPCDLEEDQLEPIMKNYAKDNKENDDSDDFIIDRGVANAWTSGSEISSGMHPIPESDITYYSKTFNTVDVSRQVLSWLGKTVRWDWNMEGKAWKLTYTQLSDENN